MAAATSDREARALPRVRLLVGGGILAGGLGLSVLFSRTGLGLACPFLALTGWQCPLCGGTRMGAALVQGDLGAAYAANPLALVAVVALGLLTLGWALERAGGPVIRPPRRLGDAVRRLPTPVWLLLGALAAVAYTVLRNLA